jgi:hypothetical protein
MYIKICIYIYRNSLMLQLVAGTWSQARRLARKLPPTLTRVRERERGKKEEGRKGWREGGK